MDACNLGLTNKLLAVGDVKSLCDDEGKFKRALQCVNGLQSGTLKVSDGINELKAECKCNGTSDNTYTLSLRLNKELKSILSAKCSCPFKAKFSREDQLCKHIISLLLKHFCYDFRDGDKEDKMLPDTSMPQSSTKTCEKDLKNKKSDDKKRHLPSWMKRDHEVLDKDGPSNTKAKHSLVSTKKQSRVRSKKQRSYIKRTVYLMTPSELLETARDILKDSQEQENPEEQIKESLLMETGKAAATVPFPDSANQDLSRKLCAQVERGVNDSSIKSEAFSPTKDLFKKGLNKAVKDNCPGRPCYRTVETEQETKGIIPESSRNYEYSILDELM